jgi:hypothetical protein
LLIFPRRRRLAGAKPNDGIAEANGLTGFQRDVADDAVALVEKAEHRDPFGHRRCSLADAGRGLGHIDRDRIFLRIARGVGRAFVATGHQQQRRRDDHRCGKGAWHAYSGVQA